MRDREVFLRYQREAADRGDRDLARFFAQEAKAQLRQQRACELLLPYFGDDRFPVRHPWDWPQELFAELERALAQANLA